MEIAVNVNGRISEGREATVPALDYGYLFGDGVYETLRTYNRRPFLFDRHLARFRASAEQLALSMPLDATAWEARLAETMRALDHDGEVTIRLLLTRGLGDFTYNPAACPSPTAVIIVRPVAEVPSAHVRHGITIRISSVIRNHPRALSPRIKSNNLLNNILAMQEAIQHGAGEALLLNDRGELTECAQSNIFLVLDGTALTPPLGAGLLEGVTRNFLFEVGEAASVPVREQTLRPEHLANADELFVTSTTREVLGVTRVDETEYSQGRPGPITTKLAVEFRRLAHGTTPMPRPADRRR
ncbi:MAG: branched-chain amino acid aminotransferase [Acidobacteria bacterium]|nr:branched-chain amino acid aminotransferase [Acidobacteriota bacterium]MXZ72823.1 branched-chain amino acid aminotransferase [Acidobacteriota bacterium]MYD69936.1 branched-chain amino acid aminotransferase [Acidobacteriota bacterium]MYJ05329.1 branched-chain amino acid aminotransferase [Acidobacteriota bacterium]